MFIHGSGCSWVWGGQNGPWDTMGTPWPAESWGSPLPASPWAAEVPSTPPPPPKDTLVLKASNQPKTVHGGVCVSPSAPRAVCSLALCSPHPSAHCNKKRFNSPPTPSRPPEHPIEEWGGGITPKDPLSFQAPFSRAARSILSTPQLFSTSPVVPVPIGAPRGRVRVPRGAQKPALSELLRLL